MIHYVALFVKTPLLMEGYVSYYFRKEEISHRVPNFDYPPSITFEGARQALKKQGYSVASLKTVDDNGTSREVSTPIMVDELLLSDVSALTALFFDSKESLVREMRFLQLPIDKEVIWPTEKGKKT